MKKWSTLALPLVLTALSLGLTVTTQTATAATAVTSQAAKTELNYRLSRNDGFSANFTQKVLSPSGEVLVNGTGSAKVLRPSKFVWNTTTPDETQLVSDGKTLWYYTPFVEQVTIMNQSDATAQTPFVLLTRNRASDWAGYNVTQNRDTFTLISTASNSTGGTFIINISKQGLLSSFKVTEQDGQSSEFVFNKFLITKPAASLFTFKVPKGVDIDDQR